MARGEVALVDQHAHESLQASFGRAVVLERRERRPDVLCVGIDCAGH
jgi:hypothetical protein